MSTIPPPGHKKSRDDDVMFMRFCQLKTLILVGLLLNSCSLRKKTEVEAGATPEAKWFSANQEHALEDKSGAKKHLFFDPASTINWSEGTIKFVALTPADSKLSYMLDLASGQPLAKHEYCEQKDIFGDYGGKVNRPPYVQGFIPKVLDQMGEPQKIIYFSQNKKLNAFEQYEAQIVAGYVESFCPVMDCPEGQWISRLVLVGVDPAESDLYDFKISKIQELLQWPKVQAHLENAEGKNFIGNNSYPRWKAGELITFNESKKYFRKRAKFFKGEELLSIRKSCHLLYDKLWKDVGEMRIEDSAAQTAAEMTRKLEVINLLKANGNPIGFNRRFEKFSQEHYKDMLTCSKFVYTGNVNYDQDKFWFLSFIKAFYLLNQQGYYYDCSHNSWRRNLLDAKGNYLYSVNDTLRECSNEQIDLAMNYMTNFIRSEKEKTSQFLRFIDYDNQGIGSHEKIYNWVMFPHTRLSCTSKKNEEFLKKVDVFVDDIKWKKRSVGKDKDERVIY